ncbi:hypothetical protein [Hymenobacter fodinae]|uniref:Uncharacterized protein n=1 Tax=Hymenobacter fodinae TaxID=2510796 RepID=A0A4Z0P592_9BACT|nr:hypothetical protein [Hymenobacter fodinae]TGE05547.1 hypothetical protein EU556_19800 [Hymenobacter fodinae]
MAFGDKQKQLLSTAATQLGLQVAQGNGVGMPPPAVDARLEQLKEQMQIMLDEYRVLITGQETMPPRNWRMSNNRVTRRLDDLTDVVGDLLTDHAALQAQHDALQKAVPNLISDAISAYHQEIFVPTVQMLTGANTPGVAHSLLELYNLLQAEIQEDNVTMADVFARITQVKQQAAAAQLTADGAQALATSAQTLATTAKTTADGIRTDLTTQTGRIDAVKVTADTAKGTAETAKTTADGVRVDLNAHTSANNLHRFKQTKRVVTPAMAVGASVPVAITWDTPMPSANYTVSALLGNNSLLGMTWVLAASPVQTANGCTIILKNTGLLALLASAGTIQLLATHD